MAAAPVAVRALALLLLAAACTTTRHATTDSASAVRVDSAATTAARSDVRVTGGAVDWRFESWEYAPVAEPDAGHQPKPGGAAQGSTPGTSDVAQLGRAPTPGGPHVAGSNPVVGPLPGHLLRHSIATAHISPVEAHAVTEARSLTETHAQATAVARTEEQRSVRLGPPPWVWAFVPVALLALLLVAWRLRWFP